MNELRDEVSEELEALLLTYDAAKITTLTSGATQVSLPLVPRRGAENAQQPDVCYVAATLLVTLDSGYPVAPPFVAITDLKGLCDDRVAAFTQRLRMEAESMAGELVLGLLCETAIDLLTESNVPTGDCVFCLEPVMASSAVGPGAHCVVKLPCYHCYHADCCAAWYFWEQQQLARRHLQLLAEYKSMAAGKLKEEGIQVEEVRNPTDGQARQLYVVRCPSCRAQVLPGSLLHVLDQLLGGGASGVEWAAAQACVGDLDAAARQRVSQLQRRFAAVLDAQRRCNGLVDESVAVSVVELQHAADHERASQAAAVEQINPEESYKAAGGVRHAATGGTALPKQQRGRGNYSNRGDGRGRRGVQRGRDGRVARHDGRSSATQEPSA